MRCVSLWECFAICLSRWYTAGLFAVPWIEKQEHTFTLHECEPSTHTSSLLQSCEQNVQMWLLSESMESSDEKILSVNTKKTESKRAGKERRTWRNSMCFWLIWLSYLWIHHRCFRLSSSASLLSLSLKQAIFTFLTSFHLASSLSLSSQPSLYHLSSPTSELPGPIAASPQPLMCLYATTRPGNVCKQAAATSRLLSLFPHIPSPSNRTWYITY